MLGLCAAIAAQARGIAVVRAFAAPSCIETGRDICQNIIAWVRCAPAQLQNTARLSLRAVPYIYYCGLRVTAPVRALATVTAHCSGSWRFWKAIFAAVCSACDSSGERMAADDAAMHALRVKSMWWASSECAAYAAGLLYAGIADGVCVL